MDQRLLAPVRHPHLLAARSRSACRQLVPIGVVGQDQRQLDVLLPRALADAHPAAIAMAVIGSGSRRDQRSLSAPGGHSTTCPATSALPPPSPAAARPAARPAPRTGRTAAAARRGCRSARHARARAVRRSPAAPCPAHRRRPARSDRDWRAARRAACRSRRPYPGWRNTGSPNVASVTKTSHCTGSKGAQVGSARRL